MAELPPHESRSRQFVTFTVGGESYAADIHAIREVVRTPAITHLPYPADGVIGVVNVRGRILPVADAAQCLELCSTGTGSRILIADSGSDSFGLLVDSVDGVADIACDAMQPVPSFWPGCTDGISGLTTIDDRLVAVIDLDRIISRTTRRGFVTADR